MVRVATFNLNSLDDGPGVEPALAQRIAVLRPQLLRLRADVLCLQEVNGQEPGAGRPRTLAALDALVADTPLAGFERVVTSSSSGKGPADRHNLAILSRFPIAASRQVRNALVDAPLYRPSTAVPHGDKPAPVLWDRPFLHAEIRLPSGRVLHVLNLHLRAPIASSVAGQKLEPFVWKSVAGWAEGFFLAAVKRSGQALEARIAVDRLFDADPQALVAVCGDLNAEENEVPVQILLGEAADTGNGALAARALVALERGIAEDRRFSTIFMGRPAMLDHLLVSRALLGWHRTMEIHNEDLGDETVTQRNVRLPPDSNHAPLVAEFADPSTETTSGP